MTTKVTIEAEIHDQKKAVRVKIDRGGAGDDVVTIGPGEKTEQYVYDTQSFVITEVDAE